MPAGESTQVPSREIATVTKSLVPARKTSFEAGEVFPTVTVNG